MNKLETDEILHVLELPSGSEDGLDSDVPSDEDELWESMEI